MKTLPPIEINPKTFLRQHCTLPALPLLIARIQKELQNADTDINKIEKLISSDPSLVAQLLKVVNSGYYSLPREISKIKFAVTFLGLHEVYRMVLSLSVINTINIKSSSALQSYWFHSYYTALATKYVARQYEPQTSFEELWSAAILHDIGKLVYMKFFPDHFAALNEYRENHGCLFSEAEKALGLPESAAMGSLLCDHWKLPLMIKEACENHTLAALPTIDSSSISGSFLRLICLGNLMAELSADILSDETKHRIAEAIQRSLGFSEAEFLAIMGEIYDIRLEAERFITAYDF
jgi:HD-like signal output (HDOD) protein